MGFWSTLGPIAAPRRFARLLLWLALGSAVLACGSEQASEPEKNAAAPLVCHEPQAFAPPACGSNAAGRTTLIPGPGSAGYDPALAAKATKLERQFHAINAYGVRVDANLSVEPSAATERALIGDFIETSDGWDFEAFSGRTVPDVIGSFGKVAGLYAGVGIAADAYRYMALRDAGADCELVDGARRFLEADLEALHLATAITGVDGVIARGFQRNDLPGAVTETVPLFDAAGNPLPQPKNNGTWRADNSPDGSYPEYYWEDSCSRDMFVGWVLGMAAAWEAIRFDTSVSDAERQRLQSDALALGKSLMQVGDEGYDLEIRDADGRRTYHGILNENSVDRLYLDGAGNGFNAILATGIVGALAWISGDPELYAWLSDDLIAERRLHELARDNMIGVDLGVGSNYSAYNMAFTGGLLGVRYLCHADARDAVRQAVQTALYDRPGSTRQPSEQKQTLYDFVYVAALLGETAWSAPEPSTQVDAAALERGRETLVAFPAAPFFGEDRQNCDDAELAAGTCLAIDGTTLSLASELGRGDIPVATDPVPMSVRPHSNYFWRSNPYQVNGNASGRLFPASDFRIGYWMARWFARP